MFFLLIFSEYISLKIGGILKSSYYVMVFPDIQLKPSLTQLQPFLLSLGTESRIGTLSSPALGGCSRPQ